VADAHATMVSHWMSLGFIHGVMNTDNMAISGETIDFGPCAFMDEFSFDKVFSSIDRHGRYAYNNQISIAKWNLYRLASCLIPFIHKDENKAVKIIEESITSYIDIYEKKWIEKMGLKLGIFEATLKDQELINLWLQTLEDGEHDFTLSFRDLLENPELFQNDPLFETFHSSWQQQIQRQNKTDKDIKSLMETVNPVFIPRNHQVERAIQGTINGDLSVFNEMIQVIKNPYQEQAQFESFKIPPKPNERITATFCGT